MNVGPALISRLWYSLRSLGRTLVNTKQAVSSTSTTSPTISSTGVNRPERLSALVSYSAYKFKCFLKSSKKEK